MIWRAQAIMLALSCFLSLQGTSMASSPIQTEGASAPEGEMCGRYLRAITRLHSGDIDRGIMDYFTFLLRGQSLLSVAVRRSDLQVAQENLSSRMQRPALDKRTLLFLPLIERMLERWPEALRQLDVLLVKAPRSAVLTFLKGELLLECQKVDQARELFQKLEQMPNGAKFARLARFLISRQGLDAASDPKIRHRFLLSAGYRQWDLMARDRAKLFFEAAAKEFADDPQPAQALVEMYLEEQRPLEAEKIVAAWNARHARPLLGLQQAGRLALALGKYAEAIPALRELVKKDPDDAYVRFQLAECCYQCDQYDEALPHFKRLFEADSNNIGFAQRYAECLMGTGQLEPALDFFASLAEAKPDVPYYRIELAAIQLQLGRFQESKNLLVKLSADPDAPQILVREMLGNVDAKLAEETEKLRRASEAASGAPGKTAHPASESFSLESMKNECAITVGEARRLAQMYE